MGEIKIDLDAIFGSMFSRPSTDGNPCAKRYGTIVQKYEDDLLVRGSTREDKNTEEEKVEDFTPKYNPHTRAKFNENTKKRFHQNVFKCPFCTTSLPLKYRSVNPVCISKGGVFTLSVKCEKCTKSWEETYRLDKVTGTSLK